MPSMGCKPLVTYRCKKGTPVRTLVDKFRCGHDNCIQSCIKLDMASTYCDASSPDACAPHIGIDIEGNGLAWCLGIARTSHLGCRVSCVACGQAAILSIARPQTMQRSHCLPIRPHSAVKFHRPEDKCTPIQRSGLPGSAIAGLYMSAGTRRWYTSQIVTATRSLDRTHKVFTTIWKTCTQLWCSLGADDSRKRPPCRLPHRCGRRLR